MIDLAVEIMELLLELVCGVLYVAAAMAAVVVVVFLLPFAGVIQESGERDMRRARGRLDVIG